MIASIGFLTALECTKYDFGRGFAPDPDGEAYSVSDPIAGLRGLLLRGGEGKEREMREGERVSGRGDREREKWKGRGRDAREKGEKGGTARKERREGDGRKVRTPPPSIPAYAPVSRSSDVILQFHD